MSLKCSILGHRFDETAVERDRVEDGSEVVTTITELETCSRCGETRVVSENKEVTTTETPPDVDAGDTSETGTPDPDAAEGDAEIVGSADTAGRNEASGVGADTADAPADATDAADDAGGEDIEGDDAEILGSGPDADDPETDAQSRARTDPTSIPDAEAGAADAPDEDDDAVIIDGDAGEEHDPGEWSEGEADESAAADAESGDARRESPEPTATGDDASTDWPEEDDASSPDWPDEDETSAEPVTDEWPEETTRDVDPDEGPTLEQSASPTITVPEGMYRCSECGFTTEVESSSLRAGDFCPECHTGTLVQHEDDE